MRDYCRLRGGKGIGKGWESRIGRMDDAVCPRCREEEESPDHIVFRYMHMGIKRLKDIQGRRWWVEENDMGRAVLVRADLMEEFFENVHRQI